MLLLFRIVIPIFTGCPCARARFPGVWAWRRQ